MLYLKENIEALLYSLNTLFAKDKLLHMVYGFFVYYFSLIGTLIVSEHYLVTISVPYLIVVLVAFFKEVYDHMNKDKHTSDVYDFIATITIPTLIVISMILIRAIGYDC